MESRLGKDISLTLRRIAYEYRYYKAIDKRMEPYLRRIAKKVKNRILIRSRRSAMKNNQGNLRGNYNQSPVSSFHRIEKQAHAFTPPSSIFF
jgi:hypothetical protein